MQWRSFATLVLVTLCVTTCLTVDPGVRIAITSKTLNYVNQYAPVIVALISQMQLPNITGHTSVVDLGVDYSLTNIKQSNFVLGNSSLTSSESLGLVVHATGISGDLTADWGYYFTLWPHLHDNGSCDIAMSGMSLDISVLLGNTSEGKPVLSLTGCSLDISNFKIDFHGGASWLYNLFDSVISGEIKDQLKSQVCGMVGDEIKSENKNLSNLSMMFPVDVLGNISEVSYKFVKTPNFTTSYIELDSQGEFFLKAKPQLQPTFFPPPLPPVSGSDRMIYVWLTDYVLNTATWVYYKSGLLNFNITPNMVPPSIPFQLNTSSFSGLIPELPAKYPNMAMILGLNVNPAPKVNFISNGINVSATAHIDFYVVDSNHSKGGTNGTILAFTLKAVLYAEGRLWVAWNKTTQNEVVKGHLSLITTTLSVEQTNIGKFSLAEMQNAIDLVYKVFVIPGANHYGNLGYPIPSFEQGLIVISNITLTLDKGYAVLSTDVGLGTGKLDAGLLFTSL